MLKRPLLPLLLALCLATTAWCMGSRDPDPEPARSERTSLQLIAAAEEAGEIDADTALAYRVYAVKAEERLPERYRGGRAVRDATGVLRQARARFPELDPELQARLQPYLYPEGRR